jgi:enterochelin esterase-like enzyme
VGSGTMAGETLGQFRRLDSHERVTFCVIGVGEAAMSPREKQSMMPWRHPRPAALRRRWVAAGRTARRIGSRTVRTAGATIVHPTIVAAAVITAALCVVLAWLAGPWLQTWLVAVGMDNQRAMLLASMLLVALTTMAVSAWSRRIGPTRLGGLIGFCAIQIAPFLIGAATTSPTPGLRSQVNVSGWVLQPLGMLLLGGLSTVIGGALGVGLSRDAARLGTLLRTRRRLWPCAAMAAALVAVAGGSALTALQDGPLSALHNYAVDPPSTPQLPSTPPGAASAVGTSPTPSISALRQDPGTIQNLRVAGRSALVYVPAAYAAHPSIRLPVVYFLHGTPASPDQWLGVGGQLQGVLDQMIGAGTIPPLLAVMPDGNGAHGADTEWGNSSRGDIETWLVDQLVPAVDARYRTLGPTFRGIAGLSSGGFGAVNLAIRHPTTFRWAASFSGYFMAPTSVFGAAAAANSPQLTAPRLPRAERMPLYLGYGTADSSFRAATERFAATLRRIGWSHLDVSAVRGGHGWQAWSAELVQSLTWLGRLWGPSPWLASGSSS